VLVGGTQEKHFDTALTGETTVDVGRQHRPHEVAEMLDAVDVGQRAGDE
jgi:hypothetical protein